MAWEAGTPIVIIDESVDRLHERAAAVFASELHRLGLLPGNAMVTSFDVRKCPEPNDLADRGEWFQMKLYYVYMKRNKM
ncbi:TPA: hypothetical protein DF272_01220 [Candidatus Falkowbacteria bacterium]|nr:hypothetical protein [Candidatus Falkowbacteria bacterium]